MLNCSNERLTMSNIKDQYHNAIAIYPDIKNSSHRNIIYDGNRTAIDRLSEAIGLAEAINLKILFSEIIRIMKPKASAYFGIGTMKRLGKLIKTLKIQIAIIDCSLSPIQQRNLELSWNCKVIDRTALIIEIFGARARSHEGHLQVDLAALTFQRSRLVRSWTHLERQRGGAGFLGGPGQSQIELDRRLIDDRITRLKQQLTAVVRTRKLQRKTRHQKPYPVIALVGYTNAGKSTLFNRLTRSQVLVKDMLFATLDPTMRLMTLPSGRDIILSDTVGFISDLPTHLIAAFKATLEELSEADIIVHVRDASHKNANAQKHDVENVLNTLGLNANMMKGKFLEVLNKIDLLDENSKQSLVTRNDLTTIAISATTGVGCNKFVKQLDLLLGLDDLNIIYEIAPQKGAAIAWLYENGNVSKQEIKGDLIKISVQLSPDMADRFKDRFFSKDNLIKQISSHLKTKHEITRHLR